MDDNDDHFRVAHNMQNKYPIYNSISDDRVNRINQSIKSEKLTTEIVIMNYLFSIYIYYIYSNHGIQINSNFEWLF